MSKFEEAFIECVKADEYPGPVALNRRMGRGDHKNRLNGRETRERRQLMFDFGIPLQRGNYDSDPGTIPKDYDMILGPVREPGWRRSELNA